MPASTILARWFHAVLLTMALFGASSAHAETLTVVSSDPFNFVEALDKTKQPDRVELTVDLVLPTGVEGPVPAILFVHGAGGPQRHHAEWLSMFRDHGFATAYTDHFKPRGKGSAVGGHIRLTGAAMAVDALKILAALGRNPKIDRDRIAIMGASKGGGVAWYTAWRPLQRALSPELKFAAHIALYPTCVHWDRPDMTGSPIFVLLGGEDDWTGHEQCVESVAALNRAGVDNIRAAVYSGAPHGFDSRAEYRRISNAFSVRNCRFSIGPDGRDYADGLYMETAARKRDALASCISRGAHYGQNEAAALEARADVLTFLRAELRR